MDCRILQSRTLKSDGHLCCDDTSDYGLHLGEVLARPEWSLREFVQGRVWNAYSKLVPPGECVIGGNLRGLPSALARSAPTDTLDRSIELRIEPTLYCDFRCPSVLHTATQSKRRMGSWFLDPKIFENLLKNCDGLGIDVPRIAYLGLGEPLEHPNFAELSPSPRGLRRMRFRS